MQMPQPICQTSIIDTQINTIRTAIWALELGHDFLSFHDKQQIKEWNGQIDELYRQKAAIIGVTEVQ